MWLRNVSSIEAFPHEVFLVQVNRTGGTDNSIKAISILKLLTHSRTTMPGIIRHQVKPRTNWHKPSFSWSTWGSRPVTQRADSTSLAIIWWSVQSWKWLYIVLLRNVNRTSQCLLVITGSRCWFLNTRATLIEPCDDSLDKKNHTHTHTCGWPVLCHEYSIHIVINVYSGFVKLSTFSSLGWWDFHSSLIVFSHFHPEWNL